MRESLTVASRPYAWPWTGRFEPRRTALLVVRDGDMAPPAGPTAALVESLSQLAATAGVAVGELPHKSTRSTLVHGAPDFRVVRPHYGGFSGTDLDFVLRRRRIVNLIFVGFPFELGADTTMRQANDLGYECLALADCCTGLSPDTLAGAMRSVQMSGGIFGAVVESAAVLELFANAHDLAVSTAQGA